MIGYPQGVDRGIVQRIGEFRESCPDFAVWPGVVGDADAEPHGHTSAAWTVSFRRLRRSGSSAPATISQINPVKRATGSSTASAGQMSTNVVSSAMTAMAR